MMWRSLRLLPEPSVLRRGKRLVARHFPRAAGPVGHLEPAIPRRTNRLTSPGRVGERRRSKGGRRNSGPVGRLVRRETSTPYGTWSGRDRLVLEVERHEGPGVAPPAREAAGPARHVHARQRYHVVPLADHAGPGRTLVGGVVSGDA